MKCCSKCKEQKYIVEFNKDRHRELTAAWRLRNRDKIRQTEKDRLKNDIRFALAYRLRKRLYQAVKGSYKVGSAVSDLGCTISELKVYIESLFADKMSWDNYGKWHIDHIKPLSSFDLTDRVSLRLCKSAAFVGRRQS